MGFMTNHWSKLRHRSNFLPDSKLEASLGVELSRMKDMWLSWVAVELLSRVGTEYRDRTCTWSSYERNLNN